MEYNLIRATKNDIEYLKEAMKYNIINHAHELTKEEILEINDYVDKQVLLDLNNYQLITTNNKIIGCMLISKNNEGILFDELYIDEDYRNKKIGTRIITSVLNNNSLVYLWVYKDNERAISLYQRLGFQIINETDTRYYMKYERN